MTKHHEDALSQTIKQRPIGYFVVMCMLGLAAGTIAFDLLELIDSSVAPAFKLPRYIAAVVFALGTHVGLSWRTKTTTQRP